MKGILFKPEMIKAIVEGRKTQTRRVIKPQPPDDYTFIGHSEQGAVFEKNLGKPRYQVGEAVYIKEGWAISTFTSEFAEEKQLRVSYKTKQGGSGSYESQWFNVDYDTWNKFSGQNYYCWKTPLFMPAWAARYFIKIKDVRVERLQEITEEDAVKEGIPQRQSPASHINIFHALWDTINKPPYDWTSNPWVFVYEFELG